MEVFDGDDSAGRLVEPLRLTRSEDLISIIGTFHTNKNSTNYLSPALISSVASSKWFQDFCESPFRSPARPSIVLHPPSRHPVDN